MADQLLQEIGQRVAAHATEAYFVGGCVRDLLLGNPIKDVDFALIGDTYAVGKALANQFHGHVFWLHQEEGVVRVALPEQGGLQIDLNPLRGTLDEDLRARDLTINAMAVDARAGLHPGVEVADPTGGRGDLAAKRIRFAQPSAPKSDPLRTLRALRFRWKLGFELEADTAARVRECAPLLSRVSVERIRDELFQLLAMPTAAEALRECWEFGLGDRLLGNGKGSEEPSAAARAVLTLLNAPSPELRRLLETEVTAPRHRRELLVWAAVLRAASVDAEAAARHLALSNDERQILAKSVGNVDALRKLVRRWPAAGRHRYRAFRAAGVAGPEAVLLAAAADGWSLPYAELLEEALRRLFWPDPPLLSGLEVMQLLDLKPGPQVGAALEAVEEARADGVIRTPAEAVGWLRERKASSAP